MRSVLKWLLGILVLVLGAAAVAQATGFQLPTSGININLWNDPTTVASTAVATPSLTAVASAPSPAQPSATIAQTPAVAETPIAAVTSSVTQTTVVVQTTGTPQATGTVLAAGTVVMYTVEPGDNLSTIAQQYDTTVESISVRNGIDDPNLLFAGLILEIVVGERLPTPTAGPSATPGPADSGPTATTGAAQATPAVAAGSGGAVVMEPVRAAQPAAAYDAFIPTASKSGQFANYTCEFDASWVILKTYGIDSTLEEQVRVMGLDTSIVPTHEMTAEGAVVYGGDIANHFSGDYETNFLARSTGSAMSKVFEHYDLAVTPVRDRASLEAALRAGQLVWIKTTVDFKKWVPATWIAPDGSTFKTVLGNDHAVVVAGFNAGAVYIRDVLGPTSTNAGRPLEYEVSWPTFMAAWGAQDFDGLAVAPPGG